MSIDAESATPSEPANRLWESANIPQGPVDAADSRTYVFPLRVGFSGQGRPCPGTLRARQTTHLTRILASLPIDGYLASRGRKAVPSYVTKGT